MRALLATVLCAQVVLGAFAGGASRAALAQAAVGATLTILAPSVDVALGGADFVPAQDGQTLRIGDQVRTGSAGVALLTFFDGSETQLTSGTQTEIDASTRGYFQSSGTTVNRVRVPAGVGFGTDTAPAAALVRGTTYLVTVRRLPVAVPGAANADGDPAAMPLPSDAPANDESVPSPDQPMPDQSAASTRVVRQPAAPVGNLCSRADVAVCLSSDILLVDPDGHLGRVGLVPHAPTLPAVDLASACQVGAVAQRVATAMLTPPACALLQQSTLDLRNVAAARQTQQQADEVATEMASAAAPGSPPPPPPPGPPPGGVNQVGPPSVQGGTGPAAGAPGQAGGAPGQGGTGTTGGGTGPAGGTGDGTEFAGAQSPTWTSTGPMRYGIDEGYKNPSLLADSHSNWERVVFSWPAIQPDNTNDFSHLDLILPQDELNAEIARGLHPAGLLEFTPGWAQAHPDQGQRSVPKNLNLPFDDPNNYWGRFVYETVRHYGGRVNEWIVWNEPEFKPGDAAGAGTFTWTGTDEEFAQLLKVAYLAAKKANPNAVVSFAGTSYWVDQNAQRTLFYDRLLQVISRDPDAAKNNWYHDAVAMNLYRDADDILRVHTIFQNIQHRFGLNKPIWLTETNAMPTDDTSITCRHADGILTTMQQQAAFAIQAFALAAAAGFERAAFYQMVDDNPCQQPAVWGAVRDDGSRRPVADALRTAFGSFVDFTRVRFTPVQRAEQNWSAWPDDPQSYVPNWQVYVVTFDKPGNSRVTVLWNGDGGPTCLRLHRSSTTAHAVDKSGAPLSLQSADDNWQLTLSPATAHFDGDPVGYFFIGGDPVLVFEDGVDAGRPLGAVTTTCAS